MNSTLEGLKQNRKALEESIAYRQKAAQDAGTTAYDIGTTEEKERLGKINSEIEKLEKQPLQMGSPLPAQTRADG